LQNHFHLGPPSEWSKSADKIFIRELWSSPMVFRRASSQHTLCDDAKAFNSEARRRVARFRASATDVSDGDRILILGEDQDGKTDDLTAILVKADDTFSRICGQYDQTVTVRLLAPQPKSGDENEEELRSKNHSSTILNISLSGDGQLDAGRLLTGGDAEVAIWERLWQRHKFISTGSATISSSRPTTVPGIRCPTTAGAITAKKRRCPKPPVRRYLRRGRERSSSPVASR
jgi:hypothetical protein